MQLMTVLALPIGNARGEPQDSVIMEGAEGARDMEFEGDNENRYME